MKIEIAMQTGGGLQFVVRAETDAERIVLRQFETEYRQRKFWLHGFTTSCDGTGLGPHSFNFGTIEVEETECQPT